MNTETVRDPDKIMNASSENWNGERITAIFRAANTSKLRYPLLVLTLLLLAGVMITAGQLVEGILANVQAVFDVLNISL